jgi:2-amino-4-hydroxy-6-hydroxymethyldihydropteridine diphosphokinase
MNPPANDKIEVHGLVVTTLVGVLPHERTIAQPLQIDLDLHVDLRDAGRTDDLTDTADYGDVAERVAEQHLAIIALGSSLGDREGYLRLAVSSFDDVQRISQVFETDPVGGPDGQGAYLNMVMAVHTSLDPYALLRRCRQIEATAYRQRVVHWGPRTLDLDLLFYDDVRIDDPMLTVPHPRFAERRFVLAPLQEVAPERCPENWDATVPSGGVYPRGALLLGVDES